MRRVFCRLSVAALLFSALIIVLPSAVRAQVGTAACSPTTPAGQGGNDDVRTEVILDKIRGHLRVALPLWQSGDYDTATMHAVHPVEELVSVIAGELRRACFLDDLTKALNRYGELVKQAGDKDAVEKANADLLALLDEASTRLITAPIRSDPVFNFRVVAGVLADSRQEYAEGYKDGKIVEALEYQDSMGFFLVAKARYDTIRAKISELTGGADKTAEPFWTTLAAAYPSVQPPDKPADPNVLSGAVDSITGGIAKALAITLETKLTPLEYLNNAQHGLTEALELYEQGKQDEAYEEAASAYLDQFENVEGPLAAKDGELMETIEKQMKDFRDAIKAGKPVSDVQAILAQITPNVEKAIALLSQ